MKRLLFVFLLCLTAYGQRTPRVVDSVASLVALTPSAAVPDVVVVSTNSNTRIQFRYYPTASDSTNAVSPYVYATSTGTGRWKEVRLTGDLTGVTIDGSAISSTGKLDITNGTPVIAGVTIGTNDFVQIASPFVSGTTLYTFGNSHTEGILAYTTVTNYTSSSQTLSTGNRYPNMLAARTGQTLSNNGISGTDQRFNPATYLGTNSTLGKIGGTLGVSWTGTATMLVGYNDGFSPYGGTNFTVPWRQGYRALVARPLIDYFVAPTGKDSAFDTYTWTTSGTNATDVVAYQLNPFRSVSGTDANRVGTVISGSQYISLSLTNWVNAVIFFDQSTDGGQAIIATNGVQAGAIQSYAPMTTFGSISLATDRIPGAVVIRGLSGTTTLTITNQTGSARILAVGRLPASSPGRNVVIGSPNQTLSPNRSAGTIGNFGRIVRAVANEFRDWPVYFADTANAVNISEHVVHPTLDPDHFNPWGQAAIAAAFGNAVKVNGDSGVPTSGANFTTVTTEGTLAIDGPAAGIKELDFYSDSVLRARLALAPGNDVYLQAYNSSGSFVRNLGIFLAAGGTFLDGALTNNGEYVNAGGGVTATGGGSFGGFATVNNDDTGNGVVLIRGTTNDYRVVDHYSAGSSLRWRTGIQPGVESATAVGSDYVWEPSNNSGTAMTAAMSLTRLGAQTVLGAGSFGGQITTTNASNNGIVIGGGQNLLRYLDFTTGTTNRWRWFVNSDTESGSNAGATLILNAHDDAGDFLGTALSIARPTRITTLYGASVQTTLNVSGTLTGAAISGTSLTGTGLTAGRVPFVSTGGLLTDASNFTYSGGVLTAGGNPVLAYTGTPSNTSVPVYTNSAWQVLPVLSSGGLSGLTVGGTTIGSGTSGRILYDNAGVLGEISGTTGYVLTYTNSAWTGLPLISGGIGGSTGSTDNRVLRADGTGGATVQNSAISVSDETLYSSQYYVQAAAAGAQSNNHLVLSPKGTGAFIVGPPPDGTSVGGNNRGAGAIDIQTSRSSAGNVASGSGAIAIGVNIPATGANSVGIGTIAWPSGSDSVGIGTSAYASATGAYALGFNANATAAYATAMGRYGTAYLQGQIGFAGFSFAAAGDAQSSMMTVIRSTSSTSTAALYLDGSSAAMNLSANKTWVFEARVAGTTASSAATYAYTLTGVIIRAAGTASMPATATKVVIFETDSAADVDAVANSNALQIQVTPANSTATRWVATVRLTEVGF